MNEPTSTVKIPTTNKDLVKAYLVGKNINIGDFYAEAALKLINNENTNSLRRESGSLQGIQGEGA